MFRITWIGLGSIGEVREIWYTTIPMTCSPIPAGHLQEPSRACTGAAAGLAVEPLSGKGQAHGCDLGQDDCCRVAHGSCV